MPRMKNIQHIEQNSQAEGIEHIFWMILVHRPKPYNFHLKSDLIAKNQKASEKAFNYMVKLEYLIYVRFLLLSIF